ncbi:TSUP family transporter [Microbaculum sp. FT89]|uniref:TSUP family transporter n=1 Tax=Microbaculum sp. FT89 TaxID=3447298 RepID=UPI003F537B35
MLPFWDQVLFLGIVALGCYTQAITGFALGLIVVAFATLFGIMSIEQASIVVTIITLSNASVALGRSGCQVQWSRAVPVILAAAPATYFGLVLLSLLGTESMGLLRLLLGVTIVGSSLLLVFNPRPMTRESSRTSFGLLGAVAGVLGGLFAASGPPLIFHFYRQPLRLSMIRDSLLLVFMVLAMERIGFLVLRGEMPFDAIVQAVVALPVTVAFTLLGGKLSPPLGETAMRRAAFILLLFAGLGVMAPVLLSS